MMVCDVSPLTIISSNLKLTFSRLWRFLAAKGLALPLRPIPVKLNY